MTSLIKIKNINILKIKIEKLCEENKYNEINVFFNPKFEKTLKLTELNELLHFFAIKKNFKMIEILLNYGADVNYRYDILSMYCAYNDIDTVKFLISKNANISNNNYESLMIAFENKNLELIKVLLDHKNVPIDVLNIIYTNLCEDNNIKLINLLLDYYPELINNYYPLKKSIISGNIELVKFFLLKGANIQFEDNFAIKFLCKNDKKELFELILDYNVDIHVNEDEPFRIACDYGKIYYAKLLISKGANIHANNDEAFVIACKNKKINVIYFLLENGVNVSSSNYDFLNKYCLNNNDEYLKKLLKNKSNTINDDKKTYKKILIPKSVRNDVWKLNNGENFNGVCYCCNNTIKIDNWECCHIISEKNGGDMNLSNLKPVCSSCNKSIGIMNMDEFKNKYYLIKN